MYQLFFIPLAVFLITGIQSCSPVEDSLSNADSPSSVNSQLNGAVQFKSVPLSVKVVPIDGPAKAHIANSFEMKFWNTTDGSPEGPYTSPPHDLFVKLWMRMPSGDHGSAPVTLTQMKDSSNQPIPGTYRLDQVRFTMKGKWEIQIKLLQDGKVVDEAIQYIWI